ncbi:MAG: hypothetical protein IPL83_06120 [Bdellovibrionales bacterium]|nr:hypothetical protein [Bdellovibrionales bacterium]
MSFTGEPIRFYHYRPNVIVGQRHEGIRPKGPEQYGLKRSDLSVESRQVRNVQMTGGS